MLMLPLCFNIPESFRFLIVAGRDQEACESMGLFFGTEISLEKLKEYYVETSELPKEEDVPGVLGGVGLEDGASIEGLSEDSERTPPNQDGWWGNSLGTLVSLCALAVAWGFCNYGFVTYLPTMLVTVGKLATFAD
jgi:hypothetical protein